MHRFLIADDHAVVRRGLMQILLDAFPFAVIEEVADAEDLLKKVMKEQWDAVISDISMPGRSGLDILQEIRQEYPKLPVLFLSIYPEDQYAIRVLKAGASGYLTKDSASEELVKAVNQLLMGKKYIPPSVVERLATFLDHDPDKAAHEYLSDREFEVMRHLAAGRSVSEIAEKIFLSITTISTYRARILAKMNLKTNADLTIYAIEHKMI